MISSIKQTSFGYECKKLKDAKYEPITEVHKSLFNSTNRIIRFPKFRFQGLM